MTSEVVLMNRRAVALAADSATTITRWVRGEAKKRYFKGTNKLFHLSNIHPVGLMINGAGNLQGVPWDVLVKSFRDSMEKKRFDTLSEYADQMFIWLERNTDAFPKDFLEKQFLSEVIECAERLSLPVIKAASKTDSKAKKKKLLTQSILDEANKVSAASFLANATDEDLSKALDKYTKSVVEIFKDHSILAGVAQAIGADVLAKSSITAVFKNGYSTLDDTGVIVAGYGDREYFPKVQTHCCYGNVLGKLLFYREVKNCAEISQENTSEVLPFAKSDMIYTFMYGVSIRGLIEIDRAHDQSIEKFKDKLIEEGVLDASIDINLMKEEVHNEFKKHITRHFRINHMNALRAVVGMLPIDELAHLSETLVQIESIKERVTTDEESVSGPIDVAVITKNDGFVWIKRKHYFKPDLNPRYFERIRQRMEEWNEQELS
jgi:hypothetical protein